MTESISRSEAEDLEITPWDLLADQRAAEIDSGTDVSFRYVLAPTIQALLRAGNRPSSYVIDVGCGTGRLLPYLAAPGRTLHALDPSQRSAELARTFATTNHLDVTVTAEKVQMFTTSHPRQFDVAVVNMVMQDVVDLKGFLESVKRLLRPGGRLVATVTHPFFWPAYWGYDRESWFDYKGETFIRSQFRTSLHQSSVDTLHVHRSLTHYANTLSSIGFELEAMTEPVLPRRIQRETGVTWTTPHFLALTARTSSL